MGFIPYGSEWRRVRKEFYAHFNPEAARQYRPLEDEAAHALLRNLLDTPEDFLQHIRQ